MPLLFFWLSLALLLFLFGHFNHQRQIGLKRDKNNSVYGRTLMVKTMQLHSQMSKGPGQFPDYKFYSELFLEMLDIKRQYGATITQPWHELRCSLAKDIAIQETWEGHIRNASWQLFIMALAVWVPIVLLYLQQTPGTQMSLSLETLTAICGLQLAGAVWWRRWPFHQMQKCFGFLTPIAKCLISLSSLASVSMDINRLVGRAGVKHAFESVPPSRQASWRALEDQLLATLHLWRKEGRSPLQEFNMMKAAFWVGHEEQLAHFKRRLDQGQLLVMAVCFVGSYLLFIGSLMHGLMRAI